MVAASRHALFERGDVLLREGDPAARTMIVIDGYAKLSLRGPAGRHAMVSVTGPGEMLGRIAVMLRQPYHVTATALGPLQVAVVRADVFLEAFGDPRRVALDVLSGAASRLKEANGHRLQLLTRAGLGRVAGRLSELAVRFGEPRDDGAVVVDVPVTHDDLAKVDRFVGLRASAGRWLSSTLGLVAGHQLAVRRVRRRTADRHHVTNITAPCRRRAYNSTRRGEARSFSAAVPVSIRGDPRPAPPFFGASSTGGRTARPAGRRGGW